MKDVSVNKSLGFDRIMSISYKAANNVSYYYAVDLPMAEEKVLDIWSENKQEIEELANYKDSEGHILKRQSEKSIYFLFKNKLRPALGIVQKYVKGKKIWQSPYMDEVGYDTNDERYLGNSELASDVQKFIFYENIEAFNLTKVEKLVIDLTFSGYNYRNDVDVLVFQEVLGTESRNYVLTFFNRLCKKLEKEGLRVGTR